MDSFDEITQHRIQALSLSLWQHNDLIHFLRVQSLISIHKSEMVVWWKGPLKANFSHKYYSVIFNFLWKSFSFFPKAIFSTNNNIENNLEVLKISHTMPKNWWTNMTCQSLWCTMSQFSVKILSHGIWAISDFFFLQNQEVNCIIIMNLLYLEFWTPVRMYTDRWEINICRNSLTEVPKVFLNLKPLQQNENKDSQYQRILKLIRTKRDRCDTDATYLTASDSHYSLKTLRSCDVPPEIII